MKKLLNGGRLSGLHIQAQGTWHTKWEVVVIHSAARTTQGRRRPAVELFQLLPEPVHKRPYTGRWWARPRRRAEEGMDA